MIKDNKFFIKNIKSIVILGYTPLLFELEKICKKKKIQVEMISTSDQLKNIEKKKYKKFDKLNNELKRYLKTKYNIDNTLFISLGCRYIFKKKTIDNFFKNNLVNFHGSRLPLDSGAGHFTWRILRGDRIDCQLVHLINEKIDNGPIIKSKTSIFPPYCDIPLDYEKFSNKNFLELFENFVSEIFTSKKFELKYQQGYIGRYNPRLNTNINGWINWSLKSHEISQFVKAFDDPYPGARTIFNKKEVRIKKLHLHGGDSSNHPFMSGLVSRHDKDWIVVSSGDHNMFLIEEVLDNSGKNILNRINVGDRFYTPSAKLEYSNSVRIKYSSKGMKLK